MRYIRRKDDPTVVKASGYVPPGGLGEFDEAVYEEIEGRPPEGYTTEPPEKSLPERLNEKFKTLPVDVRATFYTLKAAVKIALDEGDTDAAKRVIEMAPVTADLEAARDAMLQEFTGK